MSDEWKTGYDTGYVNGFEAGYERGKSERESRPFKVSDPGPVTPDGLSYEEIYGSVVYQQNKKKE